MAVEPGQRLQHYRLIEKIGEGGMGVVWKAEDTTLGREVAIKILPDAFAADPNRKGRFEREARLLAALNHPNIAAVYGLHEGDGVHFLAMELVAGESLAARLERDRLAIAEALEIGAQVAGALAAAHDSGVIHRDLKPGNIQITPDGQVKVLDFGLAKALEPDPASSGAGLSHSPTVTSLGTRDGVILGTAGYMSPEQARGKIVDKRTDNWSFGCVLFECLTGRQTFAGETVTDTLARILEREPDWTWLPERTPNRIRRLLERCLAKNAGRRLRDIGDVRLELEETIAELKSSSTSMPGAPPAIRPRPRTSWLVAAAFVVGAVAGGLGLRSVLPGPGGAESTPRRVSVRIPEGLRQDWGFELSPAGDELIFSAVEEGDTAEGRRLYRRSLDSYESEPIPGTEGHGAWRLSPTGATIAFRAGKEIRKISVRGGPPVTVRQAEADERGAFAWIDESSLLFVSDDTSGELSRVAVDGGEPTLVSPGDPSSSIGPIWDLAVLPDGSGALTTSFTEGGEGFIGRITYVSLSDGRRSPVVEDGAWGRYVSGHIVFSRRNALLAAPFDPRRGQVTGGIEPMLSGLRMASVWSDAYFSLSRQGDLLYAQGGNVAADRRLVYVDRTGNVESVSGIRRPFDGGTGVSPDGRRIAVFMSGENRSWQVWIYDIARDSLRKVAVPDRDCWAPVWYPDGRRLAFVAAKTGSPRVIYRVDVAGGGAPEKIYEAESASTRVHPDAIAPDGSEMAISVSQASAETNVYVLSLADGDPLRPLFEADGHSRSDARFSPDGKWIAYVSDETERAELYVAPYPPTGRSWLISREGGGTGIWSGDGKELSYLANGKLYTVKLAYAPRFSASVPQVSFDIKNLDLHVSLRGLAGDGVRFVAIEKGPEERDMTTLNLVLNWSAELDARRGR